MVNMSSYARKTRRALIRRSMTGGIPAAGLLLLVMLAAVFVFVFAMLYMIIPIVLLYFVMRFFTAQDEWFLDVLIDNIQQKDLYIP